MVKDIRVSAHKSINWLLLLVLNIGQPLGFALAALGANILLVHDRMEELGLGQGLAVQQILKCPVGSQAVDVDGFLLTYAI